MLDTCTPIRTSIRERIKNMRPAMPSMQTNAQGKAPATAHQITARQVTVAQAAQAAQAAQTEQTAQTTQTACGLPRQQALWASLRLRWPAWQRWWAGQSARVRGPIGRCLAVALLHWLAMSAAHAIDVQDDRGRTLRFDRPAARVVSLLPSLTESVCSLGACDRLVGVDRYSDWPAQVQRLPKLGGGLNPNIEAIVALRPDVVLVSESSRASDRLAALGIKVVALRTQTHADVRKGLERIAAVLGLPAGKADAVWQGIEQGIAQAAQTVPAAARGKRVFVEVSRGPFAAGEGSFIGQTLSALGMRNVVPATHGPFPKLNPEFVLRADPDLIMFTDRAAQEAGLYPGWQHLRAVRQQRICRFSQQESNLLIHPSPRMADGAAVLARCIAQQLGPQQEQKKDRQLGQQLGQRLAPQAPQAAAQPAR